MKNTTLILLARLSLLIVILLCLRSGLNIWAHSGGEDRFVSMLRTAAGSEAGSSWAILHAQLHFGREAILLVGTIMCAAIILFSPAEARTPRSWTIMAVLLLAATGGHWISGVSNGAELLPSATAAQNHIGNTVFSVLALILSAKDFFGHNQALSTEGNK